MDYPAPGRMRDVAEFAARWREVAPDLGVDAVLEGRQGPLGRPLALAGALGAAGRRGNVAGNRFAIHPMEGWDGTEEGLPSAHTERRWMRFGRSGAKLIWGGEAFAVRPDGRANPNQLCRDPARDPVPALAGLLGALRAAHRAAHGGDDDLVVGLQLTHSGRYAAPTRAGRRPRIAFRHPLLDGRVGVESDAALLDDGELAELVEDFTDAARAAATAGFDFVDVKCCHGYLLHELLAGHTRPGRYGGSFANRTRFLRETIGSIRAACPGLGVAVRLSAGEPIPFRARAGDGRGEPLPWPPGQPYLFGFGVDQERPAELELTESVQLLAALGRLGVGLVNVSLGSPYTCPHLQRPAAHPPADGYRPPEDPLHQVAHHLRAVRRLKHAAPDTLLVGSGYTYLQEWLPHVAQHEVREGHVDCVGLGRMVLSYPELPQDVLAGRFPDRARICRTFSDCTSGPRGGMISGCYPLDPYYRQRPQAAELRRLRSQRP